MIELIEMVLRVFNTLGEGEYEIVERKYQLTSSVVHFFGNQVDQTCLHEEMFDLYLILQMFSVVSLLSCFRIAQ